METTAQSHPANGAANNTSQYLANGKISVPLARPMPNCTPKLKDPLAPDHQKKYDELLDIVTYWKDIPSEFQRDPVMEPLSELERMWLTRECLLRYLRATNWGSIHAAANRLQATITWRRNYGLSKFTPDYISPENETGKQILFGYDNEGRPCHYMNPGKQNTELSDRQLHHLVYMLESAIDLMGPGQEMVALLINYKSATSAKSPPMSQSRETLNILQSHYPERLGRALMSDMPWYITTFFKLISPFIDPVTKTKMQFNKPLPQHVPAAQLMKEYGGDVDFVYDHAKYWPALAELTARRRKDYHARWVKAGSKFGESEVYLRGGDAKCISGEYKGTDFPEGFSSAT